MSELFLPQQQTEIFKPSGNLYTFHMLDLEVVPYLGNVQAIAHLAIGAPDKSKDVKKELMNGLIYMLYKPGLRQSPFEHESTAHGDTQLVFLDRYQKPTISNNRQYLSALIAVNNFEINEKEVVPEETASVYDFALELVDSIHQGKYEGSKYIGI